jgi:hypothetical protein
MFTTTGDVACLCPSEARYHNTAAEVVKGPSGVCFDFNDVKLEHEGKIDVGEVQALAERFVQSFDDGLEANRVAYWTPERLAEQALRDAVRAERIDAKRAKSQAAIAAHPFEARDVEAWEAFRNENSKHTYSLGVVTFVEAWAALMSEQLAAGKTIADVAKSTSQIADFEGITGFMYGCAVSTLAAHWIHGEELRRWHNLDTQIGDEGERANESGGTLNPALLSVG